MSTKKSNYPYIYKTRRPLTARLEEVCPESAYKNDNLDGILIEVDKNTGITFISSTGYSILRGTIFAPKDKLSIYKECNSVSILGKWKILFSIAR